MKNQSLDGLKIKLVHIGKFFYTHSKTIYFTLFMLALIGAVLGLNMALSQPTDDAYRSEKLTEITSPRFDEETIKMIDGLNSKQQTATDPLPTGQRINPFGE